MARRSGRRDAKESMRTTAAVNALKSLAYGSDRSYMSLPYHDRRFGSCNYSKMNFDTDPLGSRHGMQGRLQTVPNISFTYHHAWNSKESDWWRDALRKEERSKQDNLRGLNIMAVESKKVHPLETEPRTVLGTRIPTMGEESLKKIRMFNSRDAPCGKAPQQEVRRSASVDPSHLLAKYGLEFADDTKKRIVTAGRNRKPVRLDDIRGLEMSTMMPGPHSPRIRNGLKNQSAHPSRRKIDLGAFVDRRLGHQ